MIDHPQALMLVPDAKAKAKAKAKAQSMHAPKTNSQLARTLAQGVAISSPSNSHDEPPLYEPREPHSDVLHSGADSGRSGVKTDAEIAVEMER